MSTKFRLTFFAVVLAALAGVFMLSQAQAQTVGLGLAAAGPVDPDTQFPTFYMDTNGLSLAACLDAANPNCLLVAEPADPAGNVTGFNPAQPAVLGVNFPSEFFYYMAVPVAFAGTGAANIVVIEWALEAAFLNDFPAVGEQIMFQRRRVRIDNLIIGETVTITHPWGTETFIATDADGAGPGTIGEVNDTADLPAVLIPGNFTDVLAPTNIGPFLTAVAPAPPAGNIGSAIGTQTITQGPNGVATVTITSSGGSINVTTNQWNLLGQIFSLPPPAVPDAASLTRNAAGAGTLEIFFNAPLGATVVTAAGVGVALPGEPVGGVPLTFTASTTDPPTLVSASIPIDATTTLPTSVTISVDGVAQAPTIPLTDKVIITSTSFAAGNLTVAASSADLFIPTPTLTVTGVGGVNLGTIDPATGTLTTPVLNQPARVTVTSSVGGVANAPVPFTAGGAGGAVGGGGGGGGGCFIDTLLGR